MKPPYSSNIEDSGIANDRVFARVDWLRITGKGEAETLHRMIDKSTPQDSIPQEWKDRYYEHAYNWEAAGIMFKHANRTNPLSWCIDVTGHGCGFYGPERLRRLLRTCDSLSHDVKISRLDCAVDLQMDTQDPTVLKQILDANEAEELKQSFDNHVSNKGLTAYIGSRTSPVFMRVYDKGAETGAIHHQWIRFEAEFKRERAAAMYAPFTSTDDWSTLAHQYAAGASQEIKSRLPETYNRVFEVKPRTDTIASEMAALDSWISAFKQQFGTRIVTMAHMYGIPPDQVAQGLGLFDIEPMARTDRHSSFFSAARHRLSDIISNNAEEKEDN